MLWQDLFSEINSSTFVILQENDFCREYGDVAWLPAGGSVQPREDVFYFYDALGEALPSVAFSGAVLCSARPRAEGAGNLLWFSDESAFRESFRALSAAFSAEWAARRAMDAASQALSEGKGLSAVMDMLAEHFHAAVSVADSSYTILAYSTLFRPPEPDIYEADFSGHILPQIARFLNSVLVNRRLYSTPGDMSQEIASDGLDFIELFPGNGPNRPFAVQSKIFPMYCYLAPVLRSGYLAGIVSIMFRSDERLSPAVQRQLPRLAAILAPELELVNPAAVSKHSFYTQLLSRLFAGGDFDDADMERHISMFGYRLLPRRYVISVRPKSAMSAEQLDSAAFSLLNLFTNSVYALREGTILYFHSRETDDPLLPETLKRWDSYLNHYGFSAGASSHFFHFSQCTYASRQAIVALLMGREVFPDRSMISYDEIRAFSQASVLSQGEAYQVLVHPEVAKLLEYDDTHGTALSRMLYLYIRYPKEPEKVYGRLHIHKNTLYSRLYKIQSIIDVDVNDGEFITQANISYHLLKYNHRISWPME